MAQDQQTFRRASSAALVGLLTHLGIAIGMALLGLYAESPALHAATWHAFGGLPIWLILWIVFHQHRLERVEAMEAEQLAQSNTRTAALFEEAGDNLAIARRRLEGLYKWWVPGVGLAVSLYLLGVGGALLYLNYRAHASGSLAGEAIGSAAAANAAIVFVVLVVVAFVAFLVARYVAGMTKVRDWTLLRGGASYLIGVVVVALLLAAGVGFVYFGDPRVIAALAVLIPAVMVLLGCEMLLGLVFGFYRPRRPGEVPRPAFDSRVLGWLTRPESLGKSINEAINYQFGFEISKSWFYRLLGKAITPLVAVGVVVLFLLTSMVVVGPEQQAVVTQFGKFQRIAEPGLNFKLPWPIERAEKYDVFRVHTLMVGSEGGELRPGVPILWTNQHTEATEQYMVTAPTRALVASGADDEDAVAAGQTQSVAGELIGARVAVKYRIRDLEKSVNAAVNPAQALQMAATSRVNAFFAQHDVDWLLTRGRAEAGRALAEGIQADSDRMGLGMEVVFVGFETLHPPQQNEVAAKFHEQIDARQEKQSAIEDAEKAAITTLAEVAGSRSMAEEIDRAIAELERVRQASAGASADAVAQQEVEVERLLDAAGGRAAQLIYEARAYRWEHALGERARAMRMASQYESYRAAPEYFRKRMYLDTIGEALRDRRKIVVSGDPAGQMDIRIDAQTEQADLTGIFNE